MHTLSSSSYGRVDSYPGLLAMRTEEHSFAFHAEVSTRVERKRQACLWSSLTQCQAALDPLYSKGPLQLALLETWTWTFSSSCKPPQGAVFQMGKTLDGEIC